MAMYPSVTQPQPLLQASIPSPLLLTSLAVTDGDSELYLGYATGSLDVYGLSFYSLKEEKEKEKEIGSDPRLSFVVNGVKGLSSDSLSSSSSSSSSSSTLCNLILSKPHFSKKSIDALHLFSHSDLLLVFSDNTAVVYNRHSLDRIHVLRDIKSPLSADFNLLSTETTCVLAIGMHRKLILYRFSPPFTILHKREYSLTFACRCISFHPQAPFLAIASSKEISLLNIETGEVSLLFSWHIPSFSLRSAIKVHVKYTSQSLLAFNSQHVMKMEDAVQTKSDWQVPLEALVSLGPFLFGLLQGSKAIVVKVNEKTVQKIDFSSPIQWCASNHYLYTIENTQLTRWSLVPLDTLVSQLKQMHRYDDAVEWIEAHELPRDDKKQYLYTTRLAHAQMLFQTKRYTDAMHWFKELCVPPSSVLSLYPCFPFLSSLLHALGATTHDVVGPCVFPPPSTEDGVDTYVASTKLLASFLLEWRSLLNRLRRSYSDVHLPGAGAAASMVPSAHGSSMASLASTASSVLARLSNTWTPEEVFREAVVIDTALLQIYLVERSDAMLGPLVRVKNFCHVSIAKELLWRYKKYSELIDFYQKKEMHHEALEMLKELYHNSNAETGEPSDFESLPTYLSYLRCLESNESQFPLIFEHLLGIFQHNAKEALAFIYTTSLPSHRVIEFLASEVSTDCVLEYIEHKIQTAEESNTQLDGDLQLHYVKYLVLEIGKQPESDEPWRSKLHSHLHHLHVSHLPAALQIVPESQFEEQFIIHKRLNAHSNAFRILVDKLQDLNRAQDFVDEVGLFHDELILAFYRLSPEKVQGLVQRYAENLSLETLCQVLNANDFLRDIHSILTNAYARSQAHLHQSILARNLAGKEKTMYQLQLAKLHLGSIIIDEVVMCFICKKRIGTSAFVTWKDTPKVAHYGCQYSKSH